MSTDRTPLQEVILANFHPPKFSGGSWTVNPEEMYKAVRAHIADEVTARLAEAEDLDPVRDQWDAGYVTGVQMSAQWITEGQW